MMGEDFVTGIVILNYNASSATCHVIEIAKRIDELSYVVVVDNASEESISNIKKYCGGKVELIENKENLGYARGNNIGLKRLKDHGCKYAFVSNPDVEFTKKTVCSMIDSMNSDYVVVGCNRQVLDSDKILRLDWKIPSFLDEIRDSTFIIKRFFSDCSNYLYPNELKLVDVEVVPGAFFCVDLDFLINVDWLDERTFLWYEENILAAKVKREGKRECIRLDVKYYAIEKDRRTVRSINNSRRRRIVYESRRVYQNNYMEIGVIRRVLLKFMMKYWLVVGLFIDWIREKRNGVEA